MKRQKGALSQQFLERCRKIGLFFISLAFLPFIFLVSPGASEESEDVSPVIKNFSLQQYGNVIAIKLDFENVVGDPKNLVFHIREVIEKENTISLTQFRFRLAHITDPVIVSVDSQNNMKGEITIFVRMADDYVEGDTVTHALCVEDSSQRLSKEVKASVILRKSSVDVEPYKHKKHEKENNNPRLQVRRGSFFLVFCSYLA